MTEHRATEETFDEAFDVVVVGSGGAAMSTALAAADEGASVVILEKQEVIGGTTGVSGGVLWVPQNHHLEAEGLADSRDDAISYIRAIAGSREHDPSLVERFVDTAPTVLRFLESASPLRTQRVVNLIDYYAAIIDRVPGCKPFSRSVEPLPYPARDELGPEWADKVAARSTLLSLGASTTLNEDLSGGFDLHRDELARRERDGIRVKGAALIACLLRAVLDRGADVRTASPVDRLVPGPSGEVAGVELADGHRIAARGGVVLACGGFEWNDEMVQTFLGYEVKPLSPEGNTGDGHVMAMEVGARLGSMTTYWGQGASFDPAIRLPSGGPAPQMMMGLGPGSIIVNRHGRRFMSGGYTYNDFPKPFGNFDQALPGLANAGPAWIVFGPSVRSSIPIMSVGPDDPTPDWIVTADTPDALASEIGVDAAALATTISAYNESAAAGTDPDFGQPHVAPVDGPPFYAIEQWPATLGTSGGCRIDADGRVLGHRHDVIPGLYAAGNTAAAVLGGAYLGGGTPIACGMIFGHHAGRHAAGNRTR